MIIVFLFFGLMIILALIVTLFMLSTIKLKIDNLKIDTQKKPIFESDLKIKIQFYIFKKVKWMSITWNKEKIEKTAKRNKIEEKIKEKIIKEDVKEIIKKFKIHLEKLDLAIGIGIQEDAALTAISVGVISSILGMIIRNVKNPQNCNFQVVPIYGQRRFNKSEFR